MRPFLAVMRNTAPVASTALGVFVLIDVLRVFLPSLITIYGQAGGTPAEQMGAYAVSWFVIAFGAVGLALLVRARVIAYVAGVALVLGRALLQFTDGYESQLYLASLALLAGLCWLVATAMTFRDMRPAVIGVVSGLALATAVHAALDTIDLMWRTGPVPGILIAVELAAFGVTLAARRSYATESDHIGAPRAWLTVGPALLLWGLYTGNTAHAQATAGWPAPIAAAVVSAAGLLAVAVVSQPRRWTRHPLVPAVLLVLSAAAFGYGEVTVAGIHGVAPWWVVPAQVVGALALAGCLGWVASTVSTPHHYRSGLAAATGLLLFVIGVFGYFAAYDLFLPNDYLPVVFAVLVGALSAIGAHHAVLSRLVAPLRRNVDRAATGPLDTVGDSAVEDDGVAHAGADAVASVSVAVEPAGLGPAIRAVAGAIAAVLAVFALPLWSPTADPVESATDGLRVAAYNIRMGFGLAGTLSIAEQAETLRGLRAHVIVLSEVDRAWLLNGGHDDLRLIAQRLGMRYLWAPATDEVWGDALLTNLPVTSVRNHVLAQGGPTGAQALQVRVRWQDRDVTVIATHLQPPSGWSSLAQVEQLRDIVQATTAPTIVAGDLNLEPGDPAWQVLLDADLTDPIAPVRPFYTIPGESDEQIDHILVTPGFTGRDQVNPNVAHSDHRPIAVTLIPA